MSYNYDWWKSEQESRGIKNWQRMSKGAEWYTCLTKHKAAQDPLSGVYYYEYGEPEELVNLMVHYYVNMGYDVYTRECSRAGFLQSDTFVIVPYLGQWGRGWIIAKHKSASSVHIWYVLPAGGDPDGIADNHQ